MLAFQKYFVVKKLTHGALQSRIRYTCAIWFVCCAHNFLTGGQLYAVKIIYQSSDVIFSKQMTDPLLPLPLELSYLQYPSSMGFAHSLYLYL
jgi:hypothetical protein